MLEWDYANHTLTLLMPGNVLTKLHKFLHLYPKWPMDAPHSYNLPTIGHIEQLPVLIDDLEMLPLAEITHIQQVACCFFSPIPWIPQCKLHWSPYHWHIQKVCMLLLMQSPTFWITVHPIQIPWCTIMLATWYFMYILMHHNSTKQKPTAWLRPFLSQQCPLSLASAPQWHSSHSLQHTETHHVISSQGRTWCPIC